MNLIRKALAWLTTPRKDTTQEQLKSTDFDYDQHVQGWIAFEHEKDRKRSLETIPEPPDLTYDPDTEVPAPHLGQAQHVDLSKPVARGEQAPTQMQSLAPSDWDLLSPEEKALFEQITPHNETKLVSYPAPVELTTADWVTGQLAKAGYSEAVRLRFAGWRRVGVGMSMRHLGDLKRRAEAKDETLSVHDLIALRTRGIA